MPGAKVTDVDGNKWVCGPDGQWFRDYATFTSTETRGTRPATGAAVSGTLLR
jgi:hypothetical protein